MSCEKGNTSQGDIQGGSQDGGESSQEQEKQSQEEKNKKEIKRTARINELEFGGSIYDPYYRSYDDQVNMRSVLYSYIIKEYSLGLHKDLKNRRVLKTIFFSVIVAILLAITVIFIIALFKSFSLIKTTQNKDNEFVLSLLLQAVTAIAAALASILVLPKIIANYLFNPKEEHAIRTMIEKIQRYDTSMIPKEADKMKVRKFEDEKGNLETEDLTELEDLAEAGATQEDLPDNVFQQDNNTPLVSSAAEGNDTSQDEDASSGNNAPMDDTPLDSGNSSGNNTQGSDVPQEDNTSQKDDAPCDDGDSRE